MTMSKSTAKERATTCQGSLALPALTSAGPPQDNDGHQFTKVPVSDKRQCALSFAYLVDVRVLLRIREYVKPRIKPVKQSYDLHGSGSVRVLGTILAETDDT